MEINTGKKEPEGKIVFLRLDPELYGKLEELRVQTKSRGVATVIRHIVVAALAEGITVRRQGATKARPKGRVESRAVA